MSGNSRLPSGEQGVREYRSVCTWASQKSGRIVEDAAVEVLAPALVSALGGEQLESPFLVSGHEKGSKRFRCGASADHAVKDAFPHGRMPEGVEVDERRWLRDPMTRECSWGPDLDRGPLLADTGVALR